MNELFSDYFAQRDNLLTRLDARLKAVFVIMAIILTLYSRRAIVSCGIILLVPVVLLSLKIPLKIIIHRICAPPRNSLEHPMYPDFLSRGDADMASAYRGFKLNSLRRRAKIRIRVSA